MYEDRRPERPARGAISTKTAVFLMFVVGISVAICTWAIMYSINASKTVVNENRFSKLIEAAEIMEENYVTDVDIDNMMDAAVNAMVESLGDRWSYYVSVEELESYESNVNNNYVGVGVTVERTTDKGLLVISVAEGGGAEEAGITAGSYITAADGQSIIGYELSDATALIKGAEGTTVVLTVRDEAGRTQELTVERRTIEVDPVSAQFIGDIGYVTLENFNASSAESFNEKVDALIEQGAKGLIFDVRFNGGGRVSELCDMLDHLLPECTIFVTDDKYGNRDVMESDAECIEQLPCVVLVNEDSYSAAEYFAAVQQEYGTAEVVGVQTSGKGYSQAPISLSDGSVISLSTRTYYTPSGISLEGVGISPDHVVDLTDEQYQQLYYGELAIEDDPQLQYALELLNDEIAG